MAAEFKRSMDPRVVLLRDRRSEIKEPRLKQFYSYWLDRKGSRRLPARRDIDPLDFPYILAHLMLIDVQRDPLRFHVRVHGTERARRAGRDLTGKLLDELPTPEYRKYAIERCVELVRSAEPTLVEYAQTFDDRLYRYEAIWLPLSEDGQIVTQLLCALIYEDSR